MAGSGNARSIGRNKTVGTIVGWQLLAAQVMEDMGIGEDGGGGGGTSARRAGAGAGAGPGPRSAGGAASGRAARASSKSRRSSRTEVTGDEAADSDDEYSSNMDPKDKHRIFHSIENITKWSAFGEEYELGQTMGSGAFGKAVEAAHKETGAVYVVKIVDTRGMSVKACKEVRNEVRVLSCLSHPNIVQYKEAFFEDGMLYIVMEMCEKGDLTAFIKGRNGHHLPEDDVMRIFVQVCLGLAHTHSEGVLHRDMKPSNILLTKGHIVKLADFGIARVMNSKAQLAKTVVGTPYYLSPEICEDRPYGTASDMWSLGCVLYELCALRRPFEGSSFPSLVVRILSGKYPPIPAMYSSDLRGVIDALLQKNPRDRASLSEILSLEYVREHLASYAGYIKSTVPRRFVSMRKNLEAHVGSSVFYPDAGEGADGHDGEAAQEFDPHAQSHGARSVEPDRKSRLSVASGAHLGGRASSDEDDWDPLAGEPEDMDVSKTRSQIKGLESDPILHKVAADGRLAADVERARHLAGAIDAMGRMGESGRRGSRARPGVSRRNSYNGGEMRRLVIREAHASASKPARKSVVHFEEPSSSEDGEEGAGRSDPGERKAPTKPSASTAMESDPSPHDMSANFPQFASAQIPQEKSYHRSTSWGKTASEGVTDVSRLPTGGANMVPPHRMGSGMPPGALGGSPGRSSPDRSPAREHARNASVYSRAISHQSRASTVNRTQAKTVLRQVDRLIAGPSQKYISTVESRRSSAVAGNRHLSEGQSGRASALPAVGPRSRPPHLPVGRIKSERQRAERESSSGAPAERPPAPRASEGGSRAYARMDSRIAGGRVWERRRDGSVAEQMHLAARRSSVAPRASVVLDAALDRAAPGPAPSPGSPGSSGSSGSSDDLEGPDDWAGADDGVDADLKRLAESEEAHGMATEQLARKAQELRAACVARSPMPLVEAALAYIRSSHPGVGKAASLGGPRRADAQRGTEGLAHEDRAFRRILDVDDASAPYVWLILFKICVYEEMVANRNREVRESSSSRSLAASAQRARAATGHGSGEYSAGRSFGASTKVSSIASEVIPEDDESQYRASSSGRHSGRVSPLPGGAAPPANARAPPPPPAPGGEDDMVPIPEGSREGLPSAVA